MMVFQDAFSVKILKKWYKNLVYLTIFRRLEMREIIFQNCEEP